MLISICKSIEGASSMLKKFEETNQPIHVTWNMV